MNDFRVSIATSNYNVEQGPTESWMACHPCLPVEVNSICFNVGVVMLVLCFLSRCCPLYGCESCLLVLLPSSPATVVPMKGKKRSPACGLADV